MGRSKGKLTEDENAFCDIEFWEKKRHHLEANLYRKCATFDILIYTWEQGLGTGNRIGEWVGGTRTGNGNKNEKLQRGIGNGKEEWEREIGTGNGG